MNFSMMTRYLIVYNEDVRYSEAMPRYFIDTHDGDLFLKDEEGLDLHGLQEARVQAQGALADLAREKIARAGSAWSMTTFVRAALSLAVQEEP